MANVTFESLQSKIQSQQAIIRQQKITGEKGIQSLIRVHPRTPPSVWFGERKPQIETIKSRLVELKEAETKLSEQEQLLAERKAEGWKIRQKQSGDLEFYKMTRTEPTATGGGRRAVRAIKVHWINREGKSVTSLTHVDNLENIEQEIREVHGGRVTTIETHEATPQIKSTVLWKEDIEALPAIIREPVKTTQQIVGYTSFYERFLETPLKKVLPTPAKFAEVRGVPSDVFKEWRETKVTTTTRELTQTEIKDLLSKMSKTERVVWFKEHAEFGVGEGEKKSWSKIKKEHPDWDLTVVGTEAKILTPETDTGQLFKVMGEEYLKSPGIAGVVRAGAIGFLSAFRFETIAAGLLGPRPSGGMFLAGVVSPKAVGETLRWEYSIKDKPPLEKFVGVQIPAYETAIVPFVAGAVVGKGISVLSKFTSGFAKAHPIVTKASGISLKVVTGGLVGYGYAEPTVSYGLGGITGEQYAARIGKFTTQLAFFGLGAKWVSTPKYVGGRKVGKDTLEFQRFVTRLGKKPLIKYGKSTILEQTPRGFRKVIPSKVVAGEAAKSRFEIVGKVMRDPFVQQPTSQPLKVTSLNMDVAYAEVARYGVTGVTPTVAGAPPGLGTALMVRPSGVLVPTKISIKTFDLGAEAKALFRIPLEPKTRVELKAEREIKELWDERLQKQYELNLELVAKKFGVSFKQPKTREQVLRVESLDTKLGFGKITKYGVTGTVATLPKPEGIEVMGMKRYLHWIQEKGWLRGIHVAKKDEPFLGQFIPGVGEGIIEINKILLEKGIFKEKLYARTLRHELIHFQEPGMGFETDIPYEKKPSEIFAFKYEKRPFPFKRVTPEWLEPTSKTQTFMRELYPEYVKGALVVRKKGVIVPLDIGKTPYGYFKPDLQLQFKQISRIPLEPKSKIELKQERELKRLWNEKLQSEYELNIDIVARKFKTSFKKPKPTEQVLRVETLDTKLGFARVFKYGVAGVTPTVVGKPPVPGPGIYTGRQPILRPISDLILWDWLKGKPIRPAVQKEPAYKIFTIKMKPLRYTLKDIVKEPKIEPGDFITREGQILKTVTKTKPPVFRPRFVRPEPVYDPLSTYGDYEFIRNDVVENFNRIVGEPKPRGKIQPTGFRSEIVKYFPTVFDVRKKVKPDVDVGVKTALDRDMTRMQSQFPVSKIETDVMLDMGKVYDTSQMQTQADLQIFDYRTDILSVEKTATAQAQAMDVASMQRLITEQITTQIKTKKGAGGLPDTTYKMFGHTTGQGYNVKIKERHIVKGKKIKEGRFIRVNKRPISFRNAWALRGMILDNSAAASGKIVPVNAMAQEPLIDLKSFDDIAHKFYMKDDILVEKRKHRIDTRGEVKGISALGWYAEKSKKAERKRQRAVAPRARQKQVDVFDMGMDDMMINMDKIFKGVSGFGF